MNLASNDSVLHGSFSGQNTKFATPSVSAAQFCGHSVGQSVYYDALSSIRPLNQSPHHSETPCDIESSSYIRLLLQRKASLTEHDTAAALKTESLDRIDPESALNFQHIQALQTGMAASEPPKDPQRIPEDTLPPEEFKPVSAMRKTPSASEEKKNIGKREVKFVGTPQQAPVTEAAHLPREDRLSLETWDYFDLLADIIYTMENPEYDNERTRRDKDRVSLWRDFAQDIYDQIAYLQKANGLSDKEYDRLYDKIYRQDYLQLMYELEGELQHYKLSRPVEKFLYCNRIERLNALPYVKSGLVDKDHLQESYRLLMAQRTARCFLIKKKNNQNPDTKRGRNTSTDLHNLGRDDYGKLVPIKRKRDVPTKDYLVEQFGTMTGSYRRAMEVELEPAGRFDECIQTIQDPGTMLALKIRLHKENADPSLMRFWEQHMRQVMLAQLAAAATKQVDMGIMAKIKAYHGDSRPDHISSVFDRVTYAIAGTLTPDEATSKYREEELDILWKQLSSRRGAQWIAANHVCPKLRKLHRNGMKIPKEWGRNLEDVLKPYLPTGQELLEYLQKNKHLPGL